MPPDARIRLAILYGGRSAEHEVSVVSARCVMDAIDPARYDVVPVAITKEGRWLLPARGPHELEHRAGQLPAVTDEGTPLTVAAEPSGGALRSRERPQDLLATVDVVLPLLHGPCGEDGTVQGLLELAGIPYVGAGVAASALGMDKELQKRVLSAHQIPLVSFTVVREQEWRADDRAASCARIVAAVGLPCFTKPANLGSSIGIRKCRTGDELAAGIEEALRYDRKVVVEEAVSGRELECGVLGNDTPQASVVGEIVSAHEFYDFEAKYLAEGSKTVVPAPVPAATAEEVRRLAVEAFRALDCAGMARVDFFFVESPGRVILNEINTIPGFTPISMYPKLWEASGVPYRELIDRLVALALERHGRRR